MFKHFLPYSIGDNFFNKLRKNQEMAKLCLVNCAGVVMIENIQNTKKVFYKILLV